MEMHNNNFNDVALIVFTKTTDVPVKTRIAQTEGKIVADRIYGELLEVTAGSIKKFPYYVAFAGNSTPDTLISFFDTAISFFPHAGDDLGSRMKNACLHCRELGF
jgi:glycosyltransferase A (GT-A) superfamily protein (DUF2064 family)